MARSNGHNGQTAPPAPQWQHPADPGHGAGHGAPQPPVFAHPQPYAQGHAPQPGFAPSPDLPPFGQQPADAYGQPSLSHYAPGQPPQPVHQQQAWTPAPAPQDPQSYDLGQFGHPNHAHAAHGHPGHAPQASLTHDPYGRSPASPPQQAWQQHQHAHQQPALPHPDQQFAQPSFAEPPRSNLPYVAPAVGAVGLAAAPFRGVERPAPTPAQHPQPADELLEEEEYEEDPLDDEPKRGRKLMVVGALVGAICVGGGLAYAYKAFSGGGKTPMIAQQNSKQAQRPASSPAARTEAKLPDAVPNQNVASATQEDGPRRVQTISVTPPGGTPLTPPAPTPPPSSAVMPGMVLDNLPRANVAPPQPQPTAPLRPTAPVQQPQQQAALAPPAPVKVPPPAAVPQAQPPRTAAVVNTPPAAAPPPAPERKAAPVPKKSPDAYSPNAAPGAAGGVVAAAAAPAAKSALGAGGSNGYVATVLSTQRGRPEAMKAFADLQQKFPDVLGAKPAEVQEKDLGPEKGVWYRAVVGPPGSREAASTVCTQLKASGYGQCFVTAY